MKASVVIRRMSVVLVMTFSLLIYSACTNNNIQPQGVEQQVQTQKRESQSDGIITGPDKRLCPSPCCGGWIIMIDSGYYTFSSLPDNSGIDLNSETFPLKVKVIWSPDTTLNCNHIFIRWIRIITN